MRKSDILYDKLKQQVMAFEPGSAFRSVRSIMDDYEVSQITACHAINKLAEEGLLRKNGRRSIEVTDIVLRYKQGAKPVYCLAMPLWPSEYFNMVEQSFLDLADELDYELEVLHFDWHDRIPMELPPTKIDGLIVMTGSSLITGAEIRKLDELNVPYLIFGQPISGVVVNSVSNDEEYSGMLAAHHFWERGHRKLAVVMSESEIACMKSREEGFRQFAELHGCTIKRIDCRIVPGDFSPEKTYEVLKKEFSKGKPAYTGVFLLSEAGGHSICRVCHECGISIPKDLSVIVIGESWQLDYMVPALTSVGIDHSLQVREAVEVLRGNKSGAVNTKAHVMQRKSTRKI